MYKKFLLIILSFIYLFAFIGIEANWDKPLYSHYGAWVQDWYKVKVTTKNLSCPELPTKTYEGDIYDVVNFIPVQKWVVSCQKTLLYPWVYYSYKSKLGITTLNDTQAYPYFDRYCKSIATCSAISNNEAYDETGVIYYTPPSNNWNGNRNDRQKNNNKWYYIVNGLDCRTITAADINFCSTKPFEFKNRKSEFFCRFKSNSGFLKDVDVNITWKYHSIFNKLWVPKNVYQTVKNTDYENKVVVRLGYLYADRRGSTYLNSYYLGRIIYNSKDFINKDLAVNQDLGVINYYDWTECWVVDDCDWWTTLEKLEYDLWQTASWSISVNRVSYNWKVYYPNWDNDIKKIERYIDWDDFWIRIDGKNIPQLSFKFDWKNNKSIFKSKIGVSFKKSINFDSVDVCSNGFALNSSRVCEKKIKTSYSVPWYSCDAKTDGGTWWGESFSNKVEPATVKSLKIKDCNLEYRNVSWQGTVPVHYCYAKWELDFEIQLKTLWQNYTPLWVNYYRLYINNLENNNSFSYKRDENGNYFIDDAIIDEEFNLRTHQPREFKIVDKETGDNSILLKKTEWVRRNVTEDQVIEWDDKKRVRDYWKYTFEFEFRGWPIADTFLLHNTTRAILIPNNELKQADIDVKVNGNKNITDLYANWKDNVNICINYTDSYENRIIRDTDHNLHNEYVSSDNENTIISNVVLSKDSKLCFDLMKLTPWTLEDEELLVKVPKHKNNSSITPIFDDTVDFRVKVTWVDFKNPFASTFKVMETGWTWANTGDEWWDWKPIMSIPQKYRVTMSNKWDLDNINNWKIFINKDAIKNFTKWHYWDEFQIDTQTWAYDFEIKLWKLNNTNFFFTGSIDTEDETTVLEAIEVWTEKLELGYNISYKVNNNSYTKYIKYPLDKMILNWCENSTLWVKTEWIIQSDWKWALTGQEENFSDISKSSMRAIIRKNAFTLSKWMENLQILNWIKYVEWDLTIWWEISWYETLIVKNWNVFIESDLNLKWNKFWIIVLKDNFSINTDYKWAKDWWAWNVFIWPKVKQINAVVYADWTMRSAYLDGKSLADSEVLDRLTLVWSLFTRNTIGWALKAGDTFTLPWGQKTKDFYLASMYDLNHLRKTPICSKNDFAFLIKYDPRIQTNPPKWFASN